MPITSRELSTKNTFPCKRSSHKCSQESNVKSSGTSFGLYTIPTVPQKYGIEYLLPGSNGKSKKYESTFFKFGNSEWSNSISMSSSNIFSIIYSEGTAIS